MGVMESGEEKNNRDMLQGVRECQLNTTSGECQNAMMSSHSVFPLLQMVAWDMCLWEWVDRQ